MVNQEVEKLLKEQFWSIFEQEWQDFVDFYNLYLEHYNPEGDRIYDLEKDKTEEFINDFFAGKTPTEILKEIPTDGSFTNNGWCMLTHPMKFTNRNPIDLVDDKFATDVIKKYMENELPEKLKKILDDLYKFYYGK